MAAEVHLRHRHKMLVYLAQEVEGAGGAVLLVRVDAEEGQAACGVHWQRAIIHPGWLLLLDLCRSLPLSAPCCSTCCARWPELGSMLCCNGADGHSTRHRNPPDVAQSSSSMVCQPEAGSAVAGVSGAAASRGAGVFQGVSPWAAVAAAAAGCSATGCAEAAAGVPPCPPAQTIGPTQLCSRPPMHNNMQGTERFCTWSCSCWQVRAPRQSGLCCWGSSRCWQAIVWDQHRQDSQEQDLEARTVRVPWAQHSAQQAAWPRRPQAAEGGPRLPCPHLVMLQALAMPVLEGLQQSAACAGLCRSLDMN